MWLQGKTGESKILWDQRLKTDGLNTIEIVDIPRNNLSPLHSATLKHAA